MVVYWVVVEHHSINAEIFLFVMYNTPNFQKILIGDNRNCYFFISLVSLPLFFGELLACARSGSAIGGRLLAITRTRKSWSFIYLLCKVNNRYLRVHTYVEVPLSRYVNNICM